MRRRLAAGLARLSAALRRLPRLFGVLCEPLLKPLRAATVGLLNPMLAEAPHSALLEGLVGFVLEQARGSAPQVLAHLASLQRESRRLRLAAA